MPNTELTGPDGKIWVRSDDRTRLVCEDGRQVIGVAEMTDDYLLSLAYQSE